MQFPRKSSLLLFLSLGLLGCGDIRDSIIVTAENNPPLSSGSLAHGGNSGGAEFDICAEVDEKRRKETQGAKNLAPSMIKMCSAQLFDTEIRAQLLAKLGESNSDLAPGKLNEFSEWQRQTGRNNLPADGYQKAMDRPWTRNSLPEVQAWVAEFEMAINDLRSKSQGNVCIYFPLIKNGTLLDDVPMQGTLACRALNNATLVLAQRHAGEGNLKSAFEYFLLAAKWATLQSQEPILVDSVVARNNLTKCYRAIARCIVGTRPEEEELDRFLRDLKSVVNLDPYVEKIDFGERYRVSSIVVALSKKEIADQSELSALGMSIDPSVFQAIDSSQWPFVDATISELFNGVVKAMSVDSPQLSKRRVSTYCQSLLNNSSVDSASLNALSKQDVATVLGRNLFLALLPDIEKLLDDESSERTHLRMLEICAEIVLHQQRNQRLPGSLQDLDSSKLAVVGASEPIGANSIRYETNSQGFKLYCIGANGIDENGVEHSDDFCLIE